MSPFFWILLEPRKEVMVTTEAVNHAELQSNHRHQQTSTKLFLSPNQQYQNTEGSPSSPVYFIS